MAAVFSSLAIIVACLGLFALASFMTEERKKEIGIRKVMGGSVQGIVLLLSKDFSKLILISFLIAGPIAAYLLTSWLNNFAFQVEIKWWSFLVVGLVTLLIALVTISFRSIEAAVANPIKTLREK